jgi:2-iminobutanoate/2-iminopropanoate deaminase
VYGHPGAAITTAAGSKMLSEEPESTLNKNRAFWNIFREDKPMKREILRTDKVVDFPAFSQAIRVGNLLFLSGQCAIGKESSIKDISDHKLENIRIRPRNFREQTEMILNNVKTILEEAGTSLDNVVTTRVYLTDMANYDALCQVYSNFFPKDPPARCTVEVSRLVCDLLIEIEVVAFIPD